MKSAQLTRLLYAELLNNRKRLVSLAVNQIILMFPAILILLSMDYGNLAKGVAFLQNAGVNVSAEIIFPFLILFCSLVSPSVVEFDAVRESSLKWTRFCISSPVSRFGYAAEKTIYNVLTALMSLILNFFTVLVMVNIKDEFSLKENMALSICAWGMFTMLIMILNVFMMITRSRDAAGILMLAALLPCIAAAARFFTSEVNYGTDIITKIYSYAEKSAVWIVALLVIVFAFSFAGYSWVYGRREK